MWTLPAVEVTYRDGSHERTAYLVGHKQRIVAIDERRLGVIVLRVLQQVRQEHYALARRSPCYRFVLLTMTALLGGWCGIG
jgi:hypothetical protein